MNRATRSVLLFPACVAATVAAALLQPTWFGTWLGYDLKGLIVPLIQVIMFGMGAKLGPADFARVARQPAPILIGLTLHFSVMPGIGWALANTLPLEPEVASGLILVGSCSCGVASNVITYLAGGNVPVAITLTLCSTLASPFMTPWLMQLLAGRLVPVDVPGMMLSILTMIVLPVVVGLLTNLVLFGRQPWNRRAAPLLTLAVGAVIVAAALVIGVAGTAALTPELHVGLVLSFGFFAVMAFAKWLLNLRLGYADDWLARLLPIVSMAGICLIIAIITARARSQLLSAGAVLLIAAVIHNAAGYLLGYGGARLARLGERDCRTVAIEVGMQNAGMATAIAMNVLHSASAALASVVFGPWMNISGALLASWWQRHPVNRSVPPPETGF
ncbi:MAG: bile acid:sodium symporter family protein [Limisphaerales bacterium]